MYEELNRVVDWENRIVQAVMRKEKSREDIYKMTQDDVYGGDIKQQHAFIHGAIMMNIQMEEFLNENGNHQKN